VCCASDAAPIELCCTPIIPAQFADVDDAFAEEEEDWTAQDAEDLELVLSAIAAHR
jgi:hypothetical protein